jgi:hypothetical protein
VEIKNKLLDDEAYEVRRWKPKRFRLYSGLLANSEAAKKVELF